MNSKKFFTWINEANVCYILAVCCHGFPQEKQVVRNNKTWIKTQFFTWINEAKFPMSSICMNINASVYIFQHILYKILCSCFIVFSSSEIYNKVLNTKILENLLLLSFQWACFFWLGFIPKRSKRKYSWLVSSTCLWRRNEKLCWKWVEISLGTPARDRGPLGELRVLLRICLPTKPNQREGGKILGKLPNKVEWTNDEWEIIEGFSLLKAKIWGSKCWMGKYWRFLHNC